MSHWSSGLPVYPFCFLSQGTQVQIPCGVLMWNRDFPVSIVSLHWWPRRDRSFLWPSLRRASSGTIIGPHADNVIIPLDLTQLFCPIFTLAAGPPSGFTTVRVGCWGGALWRACNLTSFSPCLTGPVDYPFASRHKGPGFKSPGGYLCETGILLLALSRYNMMIISIPSLSPPSLTLCLSQSSTPDQNSHGLLRLMGCHHTCLIPIILRELGLDSVSCQMWDRREPTASVGTCSIWARAQ
jgi:hypothetical protein